MLMERASFGAGCFWGIEEVFRTTKGVIATEVGYMGGSTENPIYEQICTDETGHAEVVQLEFDPRQITYEQLLSIFWKNHNPTTPNRDGPNEGTQYRSAIFYQNEVQKQLAERVTKQVNASGKWKSAVTTQIVTADKFYAAEDYHQDYLVNHPGGYTCHYLRE